MRKLIDKLAENHSLTRGEYLEIIKNATADDAAYLAELALAEKQKHYGKEVFIRGLIEVSNICKNDCYYCGIRKSNQNCERYRLDEDEILECCGAGYELGFRTFVMQGGEDAYFTDERLCSIISKIKAAHGDCAVTLSLGERTFDSYKRLYDAGADRYLLRHESATKAHYEKLHPANLSWDRRIECLEDLRKIGYQVGCGFMVGSPYQTDEMLADELRFIEKFKPDMCGIGPFIPHKDTPFCEYAAGSADLTCMLLSMIRLIHPRVLLPATTALGTVSDDGRERGILAGANVVMPNLSPVSVRKKYMLYDNKLVTGAESAEELGKLKQKLAAIGCTISANRGDVKREDESVLS